MTATTNTKNNPDETCRSLTAFATWRLRKTATIMTALGIAATVAVLLAVLALVVGLNSAFSATGHPLNILVMRKGSDAELNSNFSRTVLSRI
ncbi:MAG: hypothetical protein U5J83_05910 [Bryobacterales bacterium]|nr:hypothetical protein [Bryobacterales bacterium]